MNVKISKGIHTHNRTLRAEFRKTLKGAFKIYINHEVLEHPRHLPHQQT